MYEGNLRFITLTGLNNAAEGSFRKLVRWLESSMGKIQYFAVRTGEGAGVIHLVLYSTKGVRFGDLKKKWFDLTGNIMVSISKVRDVYGLVREMTHQHRVIRYFRSAGWGKLVKSRQSDLEGTVHDAVYRVKLVNRESLCDPRNRFYYVR